MSTVRVNTPAIRNFFERQSLGGAAIPGVNRTATRFARSMVNEARRNVDEMFDERTGELKDSLEPIIRKSARTGSIEVGVGSTAEHAKYLEEGTDPHTIRVRGAKVLRSYPNHPPKSALYTYGLKEVDHKGNRPFRFLAKAVETVRVRGI